SMIRVLDDKRSISFYRSAFGLEVADRLDFEGFSLIYLRNEETDFELELTVNEGRAEPYHHGDGYGHLAVTVPDLEAAHDQMERSGIAPQPIKEFVSGGALIARFFFVQDPDGYKIEVLERHGRYL